MNDVYVFVGPTLAVADARAELEAVYLPPVSAGDVYRLWRQRPRAVGIIDGYFEHEPAVWHKEIMWIMERGVHVFGSAGLGALRAAELEIFGMHGTGWVYQAFRDGTLDQDDEVAVACGSVAEGYRPRSEAMVNIRRTLCAAQAEKIISAATRDRLTAAAKAHFYVHRHWPDLLAAGPAQLVEPREIAALRAWLRDRRVDQMAEDALDMLREMRSFLATEPTPRRARWTTVDTAIWNAARQQVGRANPDGPVGATAEFDMVLDEIRLLGPVRFQDTRRRSLLRFFAAQAAEREGMTESSQRTGEAAREFRAERGLQDDADFALFLTANDLSAAEFERLVATDGKVRWACDRSEQEAFGGLLDELRIRGQYQELAGRARDKAAETARRGGPRTSPGEPGHDRNNVLRWFFTDRIGSELPEDLVDYARSSGFPDELAFQRAVWQEFCYLAGQREPQNEHDG